MSKKAAILNVSLSIAVLFSILFQSMHSVAHLAEDVTTESCHHIYGESKTEITHQHEIHDHCLICHFTLSSFTKVESFRHELIAPAAYSSFSFYFYDLPYSFSGSISSLRGPPVNIC